MKRGRLVGGALLGLLLAFGCAEEGVPIETTGRVTRSDHALAEGTVCEVAIENESRGGYPCRVRVECGGRTLYGGPMPGGYARCAAEQGRWLSARDHMLAAKDGDPWMDFDVSAGRVVVRTEEGETEVEIDGSAS